MFSIINVLKKIDSAIDTGVAKYTDVCDNAERKVMNKLTKKDIMIDDALDVGAEKTKTLVVETVVPFIRTSTATVKDTVVSKATELKATVINKITPTTPTQEEKEVACPFEHATDWRTELANDADLAAALKFIYLNPMIKVTVTPIIATKPVICDGSAPVAKIVDNSAKNIGIVNHMPVPVRTPVLYRMKRFVVNAVCRTPMAVCHSNN